jgi:exodeoxyribonuclease V alpha subunit
MVKLDSTEFADIDRHFARLMLELARSEEPALALAAALVSRSRRDGDVCFDLRSNAGTELRREPTDAPNGERLPDFENWRKLLEGTEVVGKPEEFKPLILDQQGRLYLHRYWEYESFLARDIKARAAWEAATVNEPLLAEGLRRFFPSNDETNWQKVAAFAAVLKNFCVISGGPGTGKTRAAVMLLALLLEQAGEKLLRIALAAPTGKAAARLQESLKNARAELLCEDRIKLRLPEEAFTVHRLLGAFPNSPYFRHDAENPLPFDVVIVDEASMVDLALMAKLFAAVPRSARLILLGDRDQLASVEAGAVLGDICRHDPVNTFSTPFRERFRGLTGDTLPATTQTTSPPELSDCFVQLEKNYRFGDGDGILALSRAVNAGDAALTVNLLRQAGAPRRDIAARALPSAAQLKEALREPVRAGFAEAMQAQDARTALAALSRFRVLCALRHGPFGVEQINRLVEQILREARLLPPASGPWYPGRPVMVTRNDYNLKLFNGDVGIVLPEKESGALRVFFLGAGNELRPVPPLRLPEHETVFAMTVHKSQGSEFDEVLFLLPERDNRVLTRELVYTGITRASRRVGLWFNEPVLRAAVARRVERTSGLRDALHETSAKLALDFSGGP